MSGLRQLPRSARGAIASQAKRASRNKPARSAEMKKASPGKPGKWRAEKKAHGGKRMTLLGDGAQANAGGMLVARFLDKEGLVAVDDVAQSFGMSKGQLAETLGLRPDTLRRFSRVFAPKTQSRLKDMLEIVSRVADWAGGRHQAMAWYRAEPIPAFGGRTAEFLVKDGKAGAVRDYLDRVALGGFA